jgi:hypothetical protein
VYYKYVLDTAQGQSNKLEAFPAGFRMVTGNPMKRKRAYSGDVTDQAILAMNFTEQQILLAERAIQWTCDPGSGKPGSQDPSLYDRKSMLPGEACDSIRFNL